MKPIIPVPILISCLLFTPVTQAEQEVTAADLWKETKILTAYVIDARLNPFDIEVAVRGGKVYLAGTVPSATQKALAEHIARSVEGVEDVDNEILLDSQIPQNVARIDPDKSGTDSNITAMVRSQLLWNELTHAHNIAVSTQDGVVTLSGTVPNEETAREVDRIASSTRMVKKVDNRLQVSPTPAGASENK